MYAFQYINHIIVHLTLRSEQYYQSFRDHILKYGFLIENLIIMIDI